MLFIVAVFIVIMHFAFVVTIFIAIRHFVVIIIAVFAIMLFVVIVFVHIFMVTATLLRSVMMFNHFSQVRNFLIDTVHFASQLYQLLVQFMDWQGRAISVLGSITVLVHLSFFHQSLLMVSLFFLFTHFCLCSFVFFTLNSFLLLCKLSLNLSGTFHQTMSGIRQSCVRKAFGRFRQCRDSFLIFSEWSRRLMHFWSMNLWAGALVFLRPVLHH